MQRRQFSASLLASGAGAVSGALWSPLAQAQVGGFKEGNEYQRLSRPAPVDAPNGQVEVIEFFAYTCVHCFNFEPIFSAWIQKKPAHVTVRRMPVAFSEAFVPLQRLFYALEAMGQLDALHEKVFKAIHVERQRLTTAETITAWVCKQGLDTAKFTENYNAFSVAGKARRAAQMQEAYLVEATPSLGIGGRFYVPGQGPKTLQVADALIADLRKG